MVSIPGPKSHVQGQKSSEFKIKSLVFSIHAGNAPLIPAYIVVTDYLFFTFAFCLLIFVYSSNCASSFFSRSRYSSATSVTTGGFGSLRARCRLQRKLMRLTTTPPRSKARNGVIHAAKLNPVVVGAERTFSPYCVI